MTTVLVADNDADIRDMIALKLTNAGYTVRMAADGAGALAALRDGEIDAVLLDVVMPGMSGLDVCRQLRTAPATADLPVIMVTARAFDDDVLDGLGSGADDYVVKPFSPRELTSRLDTVLARRRELVAAN